MIRFAGIGKALLYLTSGTLLGLLLLEAIFHINPNVLPRGMELPFPVDQPIVSETYKVFYSDADLFFWHSDLIEPIHPENEGLEANVDYYLDQFGFPNLYPQSKKAEIIVLGRSFSMGAQASSPWIRQVETSLDVSILNLAQAGGGLSSKMVYLEKYGLPRSPEWIILEVLPSLDILVEEPHGDYAAGQKHHLETTYTCDPGVGAHIDQRGKSSSGNKLHLSSAT